MKKHHLQVLKSVTTWGGAVVTFCGIVLGLASGGSWWSGGLALFGLLITCCGHWTTSAIAKHHALENAADEERFAELEGRLEASEEEKESMSNFLNQAGVFDNPKTLRRIIEKAKSDYEIEHQDDGR